MKKRWQWAVPLLLLAACDHAGSAPDVARGAPVAPASAARAAAADAAKVATAPTGAASAASTSGPRIAPIPVPHGAPGVGFDDLRFAPGLGKVLVPAARTGALVLLDPATGALSALGGFSADPRYSGGHDYGVTSADQAGRWLCATDRTSQKLDVLDPAVGSIVASARLAAGPDYVRFVAPTGEVWVTEPDAEQIEIFALPPDGAPAPRALAVVKVPGGPESLVIDATRGRAYAHLWKGATVAFDLRKRAIVARWSNGCGGSRGIALDEPRGWLFAGCSEGAAVVLDVAGSGEQKGKLAAGAGVDVIDYAPALGHLYVPGARSATMAIVGVSASGQLSLLDTVPTANGAHCVAADAAGNAYVCDPDHGQLLKIRDGQPASPR